MTKSNSNDQAPEQPLKPNPALKRLEKLVGIWDIKGRTVGSKEDDVTGRMTSEWPPGGFFLKQRGEINCSSSKVQSLEIIGRDPSSQNLPSSVYSNISGDISPYRWDVQGNTVTLWTGKAIPVQIKS
jgi:hypothetical protein